MPTLALGKLEDERKRLVHLIESRQPQGSLKNEVTIVFDGRVGIWGGQHSSMVKVIFSENESADDRIKKIVAQSSNSKNFVVVTDDRDICYAVRACGARLMSVKDFLGKIELPKGRSKMNHLKPLIAPKDISKTLEFQITSELEGIWLKKKEKN